MSARARAEAKVASVYEPGAVVRGTGYVVTSLLGRGGMGAVYEVEHRLLGRKFVLKLLHAALAGKEDVVARMQNEWRTLGRLQHPNIVQVTDAGATEDGLPYYVMERLEGEVLDAVLQRRRRLDPVEAVHITLDMLRGLAAAHGEHAIHRDIKPQNVFVTRGGAKLLDFGIAKLRDQALRVVTRAGVALGTPRYMAPEQAAGKVVDARTDLYATGLVLFEMLVGRGPFSHLKDAGELVLAQLNEDPPRVDVLVPSIPEVLGDFIQRLLAKSPDSRPRTAALAERELQSLLSVLETHATEADITAVAPDPNDRTLGAAVTTAGDEPQSPAALQPPRGASPGRGGPLVESLAATESLHEDGGAPPDFAQRGGAIRPRRGWARLLSLLAALSVAAGWASVWLFLPAPETARAEPERTPTRATTDDGATALATEPVGRPAGTVGRTSSDAEATGPLLGDGLRARSLPEESGVVLADGAGEPIHQASSDRSAADAPAEGAPPPGAAAARATAASRPGRAAERTSKPSSPTQRAPGAGLPQSGLW